MSLKQALQSLREGTHGSVTSNKRDNGGLSAPPQIKSSIGLASISNLNKIDVNNFEDIQFSDDDDDELFQNIDLNLSNTSLTNRQSSYPVTTATNKDYTSTNSERLAVESYSDQISSFTKPNLTSETGFTGLDISNKRLQSNGTNSPPKTPQYSQSIKPHPSITPTVPCYITPVSTPLSCIQRTNKRKFPGPAGCLPNLIQGQSMESIRVTLPASPSPSTTPRIKRIAVSSNVSTSTTSQISNEDEFSQPPWTIMMQELDTSDPITAHLMKFNIASTIKLANSRELINGKIPHLRVLVKTIVNNSRNSSAVMKDPTGEMLATVHMKISEEYKEEWSPGCCVILRQVSVFSPSPRKHYLNITLDNIVRIYPFSCGSIHNSVATQSLRLSEVGQQYISLTPALGIRLPSELPRAPHRTTSMLNKSSSRTSVNIISPSPDSQQYKSQKTDNDQTESYPPHQKMSFAPTEIDDDFDAFFNDIDVSMLDV